MKTNESAAVRRQRVAKIVKALEKLFSKATIALKFSSPWELLVAVVLSAQNTDKKVNEVTEKLFQKYQTLEDYVKVSPKEFEQDLRSINYYKNKAKNILAAAKIVKERFGETVPKTVAELITLPGVGRKSAIVIQGTVYGFVEGVAVDTHVKRLCRKFGLTEYNTPEKIEKDLMELLPREEWKDFTYLMIEYGRQICPARKHDCKNHPLTKIYPAAAHIWPKP
ncbi:MAG: endonuclease III [Candidatus Wildermuthbacteria bacterium]|nr:endonuclease III [Candidatus Wildermuthbacteria bacterium]